MDIRNFFGKKPAKKKPAAAASSSDAKTSGKASAQSKKSNSKPSSASSKEKEEPAYEKRKRKTVEDVNDNEAAIEITPQDFFAESSNDKKKKGNSIEAPKKSEKEKKETGPRARDRTEKLVPSPRKKSRRRMVLDDGSDDDDKDFVDNMDENDDDDTEEDFMQETRPSRSKPSRPKPPSTPPPSKERRRSSPRRSSQRLSSPRLTSPSPASARSTPVSSKKRKTPVSSTKNKAAADKIGPPLVEPGPEMERDDFDCDTIEVSECLAGLAFVLTGNMPDLNREDAIDMVKTLGGRVTTAVSGKTNFLVVGPVLEDGRDYKEGSKYKKALTYNGKIKLVIGEKQLYGLFHHYHDRAMKEKGIDPTTSDKKTKVAPSPANPYAKKAVASNPYAKKGPVSNPYARKAPSNPYAKKAPSNPYAKSASASAATSSGSNAATDKSNNALWVDRHKPVHTREIIGNTTNIKKLQDWLRTWEKTFNNAKAANRTFSNPRGPWKAALLSGPPGIGKTTTATLVAKEDGRDALEYNASDVRSKKALQVMGDLTGSQGLSFAKSNSNSKKRTEIQKRCIIMDEVDGMGAGDRSGMSELIQMIKKSKTPIICICNDRQAQKLKSLLPYCMDLKYARPTKNLLAKRAIRIAEAEGLSVERNAAEAIAESCGNDVRQVINLLQMWAQKKDADGGDDTLTYKKLKDRGKSIQKDEMLRVSLFDAAKLIVEGPRGLQDADPKARLSSLFRRNDAFFVDYSFTGMIVQQNYPKVTNAQYQRIKGDEAAELEIMERFHKAADSMSDYDIADSQIRGGDLNWSLLPTTAMFAVKTGFHAGGETGGFLGGYPEFTAWMGKNSSMGKNYRLLNEVHYHMNYKVSANAQELRRTYIPVLREKIFRLITEATSESNQKAIDLMDNYGLSRDDVVEKLDVLVLGKKDYSFDDLDSKQKTAFTKQYNKGVHMSQALVREQGGGGSVSKKKKKALSVDEEDGVVESDSEGEIDEEKELARLQAQFKKKGRKKAAPKKKAKGKK